MPEIKNGGIVITEPQEKEVFPVGIEGKQIKEIADKAIEDSGAANEVPLATVADAGKIIKVGEDGKYELADESGGGGDSGVVVDLTSFTSTDPTLQDLLDALGKEQGNWTINDITILYYRWGQNRTFAADSLTCSNYSGSLYSYTFVQKNISQNNEYYADIAGADPSTVNLLNIIMTPTDTYKLVPSTKDLDSSKTYDLQYTGGSVQFKQAGFIEINSMATQQDSFTIQELADAVGLASGDKVAFGYVKVNFTDYTDTETFALLSVSFSKAYGTYYEVIINDAKLFLVNSGNLRIVSHIKSTLNYTDFGTTTIGDLDSFQYDLVNVSGIDNAKTYVYKCVNGTVQWVEENA